MVRINTSDKDESEIRAGALVLPLFEGEGIKRYRSLDRALGGSLPKILKAGFKGKHLETCLVHTHGRLRADRLLFIGLGRKKEMNAEKIRQAGGKALTALKSSGAKDAALSTSFAGKNIRNIVHFAEGAYLADYDFIEYKKPNDNHKELKTLTLITTARLEKELASAMTVAEAVHYARGLVNTPSNELRPSGLAAAAGKLKGLTVRVIEKKEAERLGMGAYLAVAKGSAELPKFIIITYKGPKATKKNPVVLIGKSVTFDSGGISLKPADGMEKMKYDMAGGAAVLGALKACAGLRLPIYIIGILPAVENLPGGTATRPGDIVRAITGKTIEIINTDAEGRLILADAIGYSKRFKPSAVVNIATLTGACSVALGNEAMALMGNDSKVVERLKKASEATGERVWEMPLYEEYGEYMKSDAADIRNTSNIRSGSLVTAGYFLKEFAEGLRWAHLDIASTAWNEKPRPYSPKGASGIGVRLLLEFLRLGIK